MAEQYYLISERVLQQLRRLKRKLDTAGGRGVTNAPDSLTIDSPPAVRGGIEEGRRRGGGILIRLTGATEISPNRWRYDYVAVTPGPNGTYTDGDKTQADWGYAWNDVEHANDAEHVGIGIDMNSEPMLSGRAYLLSAAEGEPVVVARRVVVEGTPELRFQFENSIQDDCEEDEPEPEE